MPTLVNNLRAIRGPVTAVPMVGQSGVVVEPDTANNQVVVRADETVLFETNTDTSTATLSENVSSFRYVDFIITDDNGGVGFIRLPTEYGNYKAGCYIPSLTSPDVRFAYIATSDGTTWTADGCQKIGSNWMNIGSGPIRIKKVIGINRIANN